MPTSTRTRSSTSNCTRTIRLPRRGKSSGYSACARSATTPRSMRCSSSSCRWRRTNRRTSCRSPSSWCARGPAWATSSSASRNCGGPIARTRSSDARPLVTDSIRFERRAGLGIATLDRDKALNALTLDMIRAFHRKLDEWEPDSSVRAVVLRGAGRAFCAGGDVRLVAAARNQPPGPGDYKTDLFTEEFRLIQRLHRFPRPWIALTHAITMGGGAGLSGNGSQRTAIDRCFGAGSVEAIVAALRQEQGEWAKGGLAAMERASPLSLKLAFRLYERGARLEIEEALRLEFRVMQHVLEGHDFYQGVRAVLVDKDHKPRWQHASLEQVSEADVARHFQSIGNRELKL